jgi:superfamily II DNA or RNA helicase
MRKARRTRVPIESLTPLRYVIASDEDPSSDRYLLDPHVRISLALDPTFVNTIKNLGADPDGEWAFVWRGGVKVDCPAVLAQLAPELLVTPAVARKLRSEEDWALGVLTHRLEIDDEIATLLQQAPGHSASKSDLRGLLRANRADTVGVNRGPAVAFRISVSASGNGGFKFEVGTHSGAGALDPLGLGDDVDLLGPGKKAAVDVWTTVDIALRFADTCTRVGVSVDSTVENPGLADAVLLQRMPGSPGSARVVVGRDVRGVAPKWRIAEQLTSDEILDADEAVEIVDRAAAAGADVVGDPAVRDILRMAAPGEFFDERLREYQEEACALHLATNIGYVNAVAPGLGKTVITLVALEEYARREARPTRSLIVVPSSIRTQWSRETARWFPEATCHAVDPKGVAAALAKIADAEVPSILLVSYDTAKSKTDAIIEAGPWDDLIVDEARVLCGTSDRAKSLWRIRAHAKRAVTLTGTPIDRSIDDLGRLIAFARDEHTLFHRRRLSARFQPTTRAGVEGIWATVGPTLFRRDRSAVADELPEVQTEIVVIDPTPAERRLAEAARKHLHDLYDQLFRVALPSLTAEEQASLIAARSQLNGGVRTARMAASDPFTVAASEGVIAMLLQQAGLIEPALANGGTKRKHIADLVDDLVENDEAVLVFTEFSSAAENLINDLDELGVAVGGFMGSMTQAARTKAQERFMAGTLDCLVLTTAGQKGLNLERATTVVNYELPWVPSELVQRVGRAARIGSTAQHLSVLCPVMAGTIEERVAEVLLPRALAALAVLDLHRGVDIDQTELGLALGGIIEAADTLDASNAFLQQVRGILGTS